MPDEELGEYSYHSTADPKMPRELKEVIQATKPWSVLVPDNDHEIEILPRRENIPVVYSRRPVNFQNRIQITPKLINIIRRSVDNDVDINSFYDTDDTLEIFI